MTRPRDIGTRAETAVVKMLHSLGFPHAERRSLKGTLDQGDITGTPGICWEVKGGDAARHASDGQIGAWLAETERERVNAGADIGVLVVQRAGVGLGNAHRWWAILRLDEVADLTATALDRVLDSTRDPFVLADPAPVRLLLGDACTLLRSAGYGEPLAEVAG